MRTDKDSSSNTFKTQPQAQAPSRPPATTLPPPPPLAKAPPVIERLPPPPPLIAEEQEAPIVTLDDLFKKTKAIPRIYYLPLSDDQVAAKLAANNNKWSWLLLVVISCHCFRSRLLREFSSQCGQKLRTWFGYYLVLESRRRLYVFFTWLLLGTYCAGPSLLSISFFFFSSMELWTIVGSINKYWKANTINRQVKFSRHKF